MSKQSGQVIIISLIFMVIILVLTTALLDFVLQNVHATRLALAKEQAMQLAEAGVDKAVWKLNQTAGSYPGEVGTVLGSGVFDISIVSLSGSQKEITAVGYVPSKANPKATRRVKVRVSINTAVASFKYAVQVGEGGLFMNNNSKILGNVYSNGVIYGAPGAIITGDAYSAVAGGKIQKVQIDGTAFAHTIQNATIGGDAKGTFLTQSTVGGSAFEYSISSCGIGGDAYYTIENSCTISGTQNTPYPGESDPLSQAFPISPEQISAWKSQAEAGGTITGDYILINGQEGSLGPKKITGQLLVSNNAKLTLTGPVWVLGNINISNNGIVALASFYSDTSEVIISEELIDVTNNAIFQKAGPSSYILMITLQGGDNAFYVANNTDALVAYAPNGTVNIANNVKIREATAWKILISNNAEVIYETGLANVNFSTGPGGSWQIVRGSWRETK